MYGRNVIFLNSLIAIKEKDPLYWIMVKDIKFTRYQDKQILRDLYTHGLILLNNVN